MLTRYTSTVLHRTSVRAIHDEVSPPVTPDRSHADSPVVRYIHLAEVPNQYSMGIFVFPPHAKIPLHDHPGMCVLSRVLYGDLQRMSLDLVDETNETMRQQLQSQSQQPQQYPVGTKRARQKHVDYLEAPQVTVLYPLEGNLHEFQAGPQGAAVLDVLLPPYNNSRDCTFYHAMASSTTTSRMEEDKMDDADDECYVLIPTGQPEDFHCISGAYQDIGSA